MWRCAPHRGRPSRRRRRCRPPPLSARCCTRRSPRGVPAAELAALARTTSRRARLRQIVAADAPQQGCAAELIAPHPPLASAAGAYHAPKLRSPDRLARARGGARGAAVAPRSTWSSTTCARRTMWARSSAGGQLRVEAVSRAASSASTARGAREAGAFAAFWSRWRRAADAEYSPPSPRSAPRASPSGAWRRPRARSTTPPPREFPARGVATRRSATRRPASTRASSRRPTPSSKIPAFGFEELAQHQRRRARLWCFERCASEARSTPSPGGWRRAALNRGAVF